MAGAADAQVHIEAILKDSVTAGLNGIEAAAKDVSSKAEGHISQKLGTALQLVGGLAVGAAAALGGMIVDGIKGAAEGEAAMAQLAAVIESTGNAAGVSKDHLKALADQMQLTTKFTAEQVTATQSMLLTFTNISSKGGVFDQATQLALDMAQAMGGEASDKALMLGKALNAPAEGLSALTRVGVTFTEEQKNLVKSLVETGDTAGAQKVILQELQKEFGGSANAAGKTMAGQLAIAKNAFGEVTEEIGVKLLPIITKALQWVVANMPAIQEGVSKAMTAVGTAFNTAKGIVEGIIGAFNAVAGAVSSVANGISAGGNAVKAAAEGVWASVKGVFVNAKSFFSDTGEAIITGLVDGINTLVKSGKAKINAAVDAVQDVWASIKGVFNNVASFFAEIGRGIIDGIVKGIKEAPGKVLDSLSGIVNGAVDGVKGILHMKSPSRVFADIGQNMVAGLQVGIHEAGPAFLNGLNGLVNAAIQVVAQFNNGNILQGVLGIVNGIASIFVNATSPVLQAVNGFLGAIGSAIQGFLVAGPLGALLGFISAAISWVVSVFGGKSAPKVPELPEVPEVKVPEIPAPTIPTVTTGSSNSVSLGGIGIQSAVATPIVEASRVLKDTVGAFGQHVQVFAGGANVIQAAARQLEATIARLEASASNGTAGLRYA
jgi:hypothetical protein